MSIAHCEVVDCDNKRIALGYCNMHYQRYKKGTDLHAPARKRFTHRLSGTPEYHAWSHMRQRCNKPQTKYYEHYGGRGIKVCERWDNSFENFIKDMGKKPSPKHTLERLDNNSGYSPSNCVWASYHRQGYNRRVNKNNTSGIKGVYWSKRDNKWDAKIKINYKDVPIGRYEYFEEAVIARKAVEKIMMSLTLNS